MSFKIFDTKNLAKTSQKLKKVRFKIFDIKNLAKISQNWKTIILLGVFSSQTFTQTGLYPYEFERFSQHVSSKYHQCSKCREGRTLHSTLIRTQKAHSQRALPILKTALSFYNKLVGARGRRPLWSPLCEIQVPKLRSHILKINPWY